MKEQYLTQEGYSELQEKLQTLKTTRRREIAEAIHAAKEQGDLSENAEYVSAKEEQRRLEEEIAEIEITLKNATVITKSEKTDTVQVGNTVTVECDGKERVYMIVGSNEADPLSGKVSNESPIGQALLGCKKGAMIAIPAPNGDKECKVIKIA